MEIDCTKCSCLLCKVARHTNDEVSCCEACQNLKHFTSFDLLIFLPFFLFKKLYLFYYFLRENRKLFLKISQLAKFTSNVFSHSFFKCCFLMLNIKKGQR